MFNMQQQKILEEFQKQIQGMKVYSYDEKEENKYTGEQSIQLDQLESLAQNKPIYYIGANTTSIKPPKVKDGEIALFDPKNNKWEIIEDCKGKKYYDFENKQIIEIKTHRDNENHIYLTEEEENEIFSGKNVKIENNKYVFYWTDKQCIDRITQEANSILNKTDFYFYRDYPVEKVPSLMGNYREYLRTINSEHNLKDKDVQNLQVLTYEEFIYL